MENVRYIGSEGSLFVFEADDGIKTAMGAELIANIALMPYNQIAEHSERTDLVVALTFKPNGIHTIISDEHSNDELFDILVAAWEEARAVTEYRCLRGVQ